ncbi:MAG: PilZ domain-containing protein [Acidobacteriia bacterium]|nr:PilZ domain-containing protein [Terriglobia bacterium]
MKSWGQGAEADIGGRGFVRFIVPGATVSYRSGGFWQRRMDTPSEQRFPAVNISKGGIGFLTDTPPKSIRVSLLLRYSEKDEPIQLEGKVVYAVARGPALSYRYRVGVEFNPFSAKKGDNSLESLRMLDRLEKTYGHGPAPGSRPGTDEGSPPGL